MSASTAITSGSLCRATGHRASNCPELSDALILDFHKGGNGGQGHSHDEEDAHEQGHEQGHEYEKHTENAVRV